MDRQRWRKVGCNVRRRSEILNSYQLMGDCNRLKYDFSREFGFDQLFSESNNRACRWAWWFIARRGE